MILLWFLFGLHLAGVQLPSAIAWVGIIWSFISWIFKGKEE